MPDFTFQLSETASPLTHFWEHTVGSDHATVALRADWQNQLRRCHAELGFRYVRFHGLLSNDMGTLVSHHQKSHSSFFNADQICDFLLSIGMRPFVELSFMPGALASGRRTVFHYRGNITPPRDYLQWSMLIHKLVAHLVERYGVSEVREWFFEVWNEPNLKAFWTGTQADYFKLYRHTIHAIKSIDGALQVGGPATAANEWIEEFLDYCEKKRLPADFVSTHHYPTDAFGEEGDDTLTQLAKSQRSILREQTQDARRRARGKPLYYTEWNSSSNARDSLHDEPYSAAFAVKTIMEANGLVEGYSFWTFSDIFEENYFPSKPFHGGFGLLNLHGIPKPAYRAFELLHSLGNESLLVDGLHETVDAWAIRGVNKTTVLLTNHALPRRQLEKQRVRIQLNNAPEPATAQVQRIDEDHANPRRLWKEMGAPEYLSGGQLDKLQDASQLRREPLDYRYAEGRIEFEVTLPANSVASIEFEFPTDSESGVIDISPVGVVSVQITGCEVAVKPRQHSYPDKKLEVLQRLTFDYFLKETNPENGLVPDSTRQGAPCSIAPTGFALAGYPIGVERGFITRDDAIKRTLTTLRFFWNSPQGPEPDATGYKGFYYHFLDMKTGRRTWNCELSTIDSTFLIAGALTAAEYFDRATEAEHEIRTLGDAIYRRADWQWAQNRGVTVTHGWRPERGFIKYRLEGYNEALILYILGLASPTHPLPKKSYNAWTRTYKWRSLYGHEFLYAGPLFIHQLSHMWIDFRGIQDEYMRNKAIDYFENSRRATYIQQQYAIRNPRGFAGYGEYIWGLTGSDGPGPASKKIGGKLLRFYDYKARGVPNGPDDGTLAPWAVIASLPFAPEIVLPSLQYFDETFPEMTSKYGFKCSFNPTFSTASSKEWISKGYYGLDQGPIVLMIENYHTGFLWRLMRGCPYIVSGLRRAGFSGGWLKDRE